MSIRNFTAGIQNRIIDRLSENTEVLRNELEKLPLNQLDISSTAITSLLGKFKSEGTSIDAKMEKSIVSRAAEIDQILRSGDTTKVLEELLLKIGLTKTTLAKSVTIGGDVASITRVNQEAETFQRPEVYDIATNFDILEAIKKYVFAGTPLLKDVQKGHVVGVLTKQFSEAERELGRQAKKYEEVTSKLRKLFRYTYEYLRDEDISTSFLPGGSANDKLKYAVGRTGWTFARGRKEVGMLIEFQTRKMNAQSGAQAKTDKRMFLEAYNVLINLESDNTDEYRKLLNTSTLNLRQDIAELRKQYKKVSTRPKDWDTRWATALQNAAKEELLKFTRNDKNLVDDLINMSGSPSYKAVAISTVLAAIKKNVKDQLKFSNYTFDVQKKIRKDKALSQYQRQLKESQKEAKRAEREIAKSATKKASDTKKLQNTIRQTAEKLDRALRKDRAAVMSPAKLQYLINAKLRTTIIKNMARPNLINRTGRFASSATVLQITPRAQAMDVFYTYMKYPYQTFEPGFQQGAYGYDPQRVIDQSIREIATNLVTSRFRTVRV